MSDHSPLPWIPGEIESTIGIVPTIVDAEGEPILAKRNDNIAFVVTACNAHYELVEALKVAFVNLQEMKDRFGMRGLDEPIGKINAALAKAKGEA